MTKQKTFGIVNIVFCIIFLFLFVTSAKTIFSTFDRFSLFALAQVIIFFISFSINSILAYLLLIKKMKIQSLRILIVFTFFPLLWLLLIFTGYLFALYLSYFFLTVVLSIIIFLLLRKTSQSIALILALSTLLIALFGITSGFEENFCIKKGEQAEKQQKGSIYVTATEKDAKALKDFAIKPGQQIAVAFKTHMLCHTTFNLTQAIQETYFSKK